MVSLPAATSSPVFQAGEYEDIVSFNSTWGTGDWNGDGDFDSSDFVTAFQSGGFEFGAAARGAAVPEPSSALLGALAAAGFVRAGGRRRWKSRRVTSKV